MLKYFLLVLFVHCIVGKDSLNAGSYNVFEVEYGCTVTYSFDSDESVDMYFVDEYGYRQLENINTPISYYKECSCVSSTSCSMTCKTNDVDLISDSDNLYFIFRASNLHQDIKYTLSYEDSCNNVTSRTPIAILIGGGVFVGIGICLICICIAGFSIRYVIARKSVYHSTSSAPDTELDDINSELY